MKATIEIPHDLYRQVTAGSALQDRTIREVAERLYRKLMRSAWQVEAALAA